MADGKYLKFVALIVLSMLLVAGAFSSPMRKPPPGAKSIESLFSGEHGSEPGEIGPGKTQLQLRITGAAHTHYLMIKVYVDYRDGTWLEGNFSRRRGSSVQPFIPMVPHHSQKDRITVVSFPPLIGNLYTAPNSFNLSVPSRWCPETGTFSVNSSVDAYSFEGFTYTFAPYVLVNLTSPRIPRYLKVPTDERLRELAEDITSNLTSDYERAAAIAEYLRDNYNYTKGYPDTSVPVEEFLFGTRHGGPEEFAAAFVILAREAGLPARLVEGIRIKAVPSTQTANEQNRWFWAEVYFQGAGWLIFDPLSKEDPNVFRPFELSVNPKTQELDLKDTAKLNLTLENVAVNEGINLTVRSPKGQFRVTLRPGEHTISIGRFTSPGRYPVVVEGSTEINGTTMGGWAIAWLDIPGNLRLMTERYLLQLTPGDAQSLEIHVRGTTHTRLMVNAPFNEKELPFPWTLTPYNGTGAFKSILMLNVPWKAANGWYIFGVRASSPTGIYNLFIPLRVITSPNLMVFSWRSTADAGRLLPLSGSTAAEGGEVYATLTYRDRLHVVGVSEVKNGSFHLNCRIPADVPPGYRTINVIYIPPAGSPIMKGFVPLKVYVRGTSRISIPREAVFNVGTTLLRGFLHSGSGSPINGNLTYYLDGKPLGSIQTINGGFQISITIREPGTHNLTVRYEGNGEYQGTTADIKVSAVKIDLKPASKPVLGEKLKLDGHVAGMENGPLKVLTSSGESINVTVRGGSFNVYVGPLREVGEQSVGVYWGRTLLTSLNFTVLSPTKIRLLNVTTRDKSSLELPALLTDGLGNPIAGATLNAEVDGINLTAVTNGSGVAIFTIPIRGYERNLTVTVTFSGASYYLQARAEETLTVGISEGMEWKYIVIPAVIVLFVFIILAHRRRGEVGESEKGVAIIFPNGIPLFEEGEAAEFEVSCEAEVYVNGKPLGRGKRFRVYLEVGEHGIEATCGGNIGRARIRVVKRYNHSVAELYEGCFLRWAESVGVETTEKTPREITLALKHVMHGEDSLETLTDIFERARYGRGRLTRREFIKFYRILRSMVRGECSV